jgi:hypothetical protein
MRWLPPWHLQSGVDFGSDCSREAKFRCPPQFQVSVSSGYTLPGQFQVRFHMNPHHCNRCYHMNNLYHRKWASLATQHLVFGSHNLDSNPVSEFWSYCDIINSSIVQLELLIHLKISHSPSDQYSLSRYPKPVNDTKHMVLFQSDSTCIGLIANLNAAGKRATKLGNS